MLRELSSRELTEWRAFVLWEREVTAVKPPTTPAPPAGSMGSAGRELEQAGALW